MLIYLDMCCLKRPFDDQSQPRIRLETEAVLALLAMESSEIQFVRSRALFLENSLNPVRERASRVEQWLASAALYSPREELLLQHVTRLMTLGFKNFDALHVASAEQAKADFFGSCDDRLLTAARKNASNISVRVLSITGLASEVIK